MMYKNLAINIKSRAPKDVIIGLRDLASFTAKRTVWPTSLSVDRALSDEDSDQIALQYYEISDEDKKNRADYVEAAISNYISDLPESRIIGESTIKYAEIYAPYSQINDIDNLELLVNTLISYLDTLDEAWIVQDIKFVDRINDDALHEPHVEVVALKR